MEFTMTVGELLTLIHSQLDGYAPDAVIHYIYESDDYGTLEQVQINNETVYKFLDC